MATRIIAGCGYVGARVAQKWLRSGDSVFAFTRSPARSRELADAGLRPIVWDWHVGGFPHNQPAWGELRASFRHSEKRTLLVAVSHAPIPGIPHAETHVRGLRNLQVLCNNLLETDTQFPELGSLVENDRLHWIYLSTTGVFGNGVAGEWVDESSNVQPVRPGSIAAWQAEEWLSKNGRPSQFTILRPAGIYGPDRVPKWQFVRDQTPLQLDPESYLNLIHVDDLVVIIERVSNQPTKRPMYCVSDQEPVLRRDYYEFVSSLGGWPRPVFRAQNDDAPNLATSRSDGNKRICSKLIQRELTYQFEYPTYRQGLSALINQTHNAQ
jgi:nucleoside-diphosphate-sugar epimerase